VEQFHKTAENPYSGGPAAIEGCARPAISRTVPAGSTQAWLMVSRRARTGTDRGRFDIIYAGGAGAPRCDLGHGL
jgi:hypothetical protein